MADRRRTRLRVRLCLVFTSIVALLMTGQAAYVSYTTAEAARESQEGVLRRDAERLADRLVASGPITATLAEARAEGLFAGRTTLRQILDRDGAVLESSDALAGAGSLLGAGGARSIPDRGVALTVAWDGDDRPAHASVARTSPPTVVVAMATRDWAEAQRRQLLRFEVVVIPFGIVVGAVLAWVTVGRQLRRLGLIVRTANAVAAGDRDVAGAAGPAGPKDELFAISAALTEITASLRGALDYQQRFAAQAAHELRTPLAIMKAEADLAMSSDSLEETQRALGSIAEETEKLGVLVQHLLDFGQSASSPVPMEEVAAADVVAAAVEPLAALVARHRVHLDVDVDGGSLLASRVGVEHAIRNLVENAVDAAPAGSEVRVRAAREDGWWRLSVEDGGPGVEAALGDRIFEPFVGGSAGGHGLGLAFVKLIAEAHQGRATMERSAEGITRASLLLPAPAPAPT